jgi:hypothetical protein
MRPHNADIPAVPNWTLAWAIAVARYVLTLIIFQVPPDKPRGFLLLVGIPAISAAVVVILEVRLWLKSAWSK